MVLLAVSRSVSKVMSSVRHKQCRPRGAPCVVAILVTFAELQVANANHDRGIWKSIADRSTSVIMKVKGVRNLKMLSSYTPDERWRIREFQNCLDAAVKAMDSVCLMVEGHYMAMQNYLIAQIGNSRSYNIPVATARMFVRGSWPRCKWWSSLLRDLACALGSF